MIASDKTLLYHFLSIAESWISQYRVDMPVPAFEDDPVPGPATALTASILVVGDFPEQDTAETQLLDKILASIGLSRNTNCTIANMVKCRPTQNGDALPAETAACARFIESQIELLRPVAILAIGRAAAQTLLGTDEDISRLHGIFYEYRGIPLMTTYEPGALLRDESLKRPVWEDLKAFKARLETLGSGSGSSGGPGNE